MVAPKRCSHSNLQNLGILPYQAKDVSKLRTLRGEFNLGYQVGPKCNHIYPHKREAEQALRQTHRREHSTHSKGKNTVSTEAETGGIQPQ